MTFRNWVDGLPGRLFSDRCDYAAGRLGCTARTVRSYCYGRAPPPAVAAKVHQLTAGAVDFNQIYAPLLCGQQDAE